MAFVFLAFSLLFLTMMEERPLRTSVASPEQPAPPR